MRCKHCEGTLRSNIDIIYNLEYLICINCGRVTWENITVKITDKDNDGKKMYYIICPICGREYLGEGPNQKCRECK